MAQLPHPLPGHDKGSSYTGILSDVARVVNNLRELHLNSPKKQVYNLQSNKQPKRGGLATTSSAGRDTKLTSIQ